MSDQNPEGQQEDQSEDLICGINYSALRSIIFFQDFFYDDDILEEEGPILYEHVNKAIIYTSWMFIIEAIGFLFVYSLLNQINSASTGKNSQGLLGLLLGLTGEGLHFYNKEKDYLLGSCLLFIVSAILQIYYCKWWWNQYNALKIINEELSTYYQELNGQGIQEVNNQTVNITTNESYGINGVKLHKFENEIQSQIEKTSKTYIYIIIIMMILLVIRVLVSYRLTKKAYDVIQQNQRKKALEEARMKRNKDQQKKDAALKYEPENKGVKVKRII